MHTRILSKNLANTKATKIKHKLDIFISNKNLIKLSEKLDLNEFIITSNSLCEKSEADVFEALLGAIYLDGGIYGLDNAYKFLDDNFREEILKA